MDTVAGGSSPGFLPSGHLMPVLVGSWRVRALVAFVLPSKSVLSESPALLGVGI